ncbi:MAG: Crp/Fnr family transcriptional regulator [bacterium]
MLETAQKVWFLHRIELFKGIADDDYRQMDRHSREASFKKGELIYSAGDASANVYMLKGGKVKMSRATDDGKEITLGILREGDVFGELAVTGESERNEQAVALEDCHVCIMARRDFEEILKAKLNLSLKFARLIGLRIKTLESRISDLMFWDTPSRVARLLLNLEKEYGKPGPGGKLLRLKLTCQEMANLIGAARETVSAVLADWKHVGILDYPQRMLFIKDQKRLESIAGV